MIHFCSGGVDAFNERMANLGENMEGLPEMIPPELPKLNAAMMDGLGGSGGLPGTGEATDMIWGTPCQGWTGPDLPEIPFPAGGLGELANAAGFASAMQSAFNIDMTSPAAGDQLSALADSIESSGLADAISNMPLDQLPALGALQETGNAMDNAEGALGVNLLGPEAGEGLGAIMNGDFSGLPTPAPGDLPLPPGGMPGMSGPDASGLGGGTTPPDLSSLATSSLAVQSAFGVDMMSEGGVPALGDALGAMGDNIAAAPDFAGALPMESMGPAMGMLGALSGVGTGTLGTNMLNEGSGEILGAALGSMQDNGITDLLANASPPMFGNVTDAVASQVDAAAAAGALGQGGATLPGGGGGGMPEVPAAADVTPDVQMAFGFGISPASDAVAADLLGQNLDQMNADGFGDLLGAVPPPDPGMLMSAMFSNLAQSVTGVSLTAAGPCGVEGCPFNQAAG